MSESGAPTCTCGKMTVNVTDNDWLYTLSVEYTCRLNGSSDQNSFAKEVVLREVDTENLLWREVGDGGRVYQVLDVDVSQYSYVVFGVQDLSEFWILSRKPKLEDKTIQELLNKAKKAGYKGDKVFANNANCNDELSGFLF